MNKVFMVVDIICSVVIIYSVNRIIHEVIIYLKLKKLVTRLKEQGY